MDWQRLIPLGSFTAILSRKISWSPAPLCQNSGFRFGETGRARKTAANSDDITEADTAIMQRTQAGVVMGTIGYMSPEQVQGKTVDLRSDIFSFGCVLYEASARHRPFEGESMIDTLHKIVYAPAPPPTELIRMYLKSFSESSRNASQRTLRNAISR